MEIEQKSAKQKLIFEKKAEKRNIQSGNTAGLISVNEASNVYQVSAKDTEDSTSNEENCK